MDTARAVRGGPVLEVNERAGEPRREDAAPARLVLAEPAGPAREELRQLLLEDGHQVELVDSPAALLAQARANALDAVDGLLWGFDLRELSSTPLEQELRRFASALDVVLLTTGGWLATASAAQRLGAVAILRRPIDRGSLRASLRGVLSRKSARGRNA
jgi:DNA-binding NtrC family response regulator